MTIKTSFNLTLVYCKGWECDIQMHGDGLWHWYQITPNQMKITGFLKVYIVLLMSPTEYTYSQFVGHTTVKCRCNERQYNEMFRIAKLFLGPFPFPYLMCVKTFHFNEFRTFSITN